MSGEASKQTDDSDLTSLLNALQCDDEIEQRNAATTLTGMGESAIPGLLEILQNGTASARGMAIKVLEGIKHPAAISGLIERLADTATWITGSTERICDAAIQALTEVGAPAIPALVKTLQHADVGVRRNAAQALEKMGWESPDDEIQTQYAIAAQKWGLCVPLGQSAIPGLLTVLHDADVSVRRSAAETLGYIGDSAATDGLINALNDVDDEVRHNAVQALGKIADPNTAPSLLKVLYDPNDRIRDQVIEALGKIGDPVALPELLAILESEQGWLQFVAANALGRIGDPAAVPALLNVLYNDDAKVRRSAARALGRIGDPAAISGLLAGLYDSDQKVSQRAAESLEQIGTAEAMVALDTWRNSQTN